MARVRAGILSMQRISNYGSFLQAYGLKAVLEELGCDVQFIDYEPGECLVRSRLSSVGFYHKVFKGFQALGYKASLANRIAFIKYKQTYAKRFYPMLGLTEEPNLSPNIDLLVIGSDEVFNCVQDNANVGFTPALFGEGISAQRKVAYAASFGSTTLDKLDRYGILGKVSSWLSDLDAISVRDINSGSIVKELTDRTPVCNFDPVLVYDYMGRCDKIPASLGERAPYMILYGYSDRFTREECSAVRTYADANGLNVINIGGIQSCCDCFVDCSPFEVLAYFRGARVAVTDTFHGTIFSIISHTPFATFIRDFDGGNYQKLSDLLERLGLSGRVVSQLSCLRDVLGEFINWSEIDSIINSERGRGYAYLGEQVTFVGKGK